MLINFVELYCGLKVFGFLASIIFLIIAVILVVIGGRR